MLVSCSSGKMNQTLRSNLVHRIIALAIFWYTFYRIEGAGLSFGVCIVEIF